MTSHSPSQPNIVELVTDELLAHGEFSSSGNNRSNAREAARAVIGIINERSGVQNGDAVNADLLEACKGAAEWLSGWASAEPYLSRLEGAIARASALSSADHEPGCQSGDFGPCDCALSSTESK